MIWSPAAFYRAQGSHLQCTLCPHGCALADGALGECRVRRRRGDRLETATFVTSVRHLDPVERKPLYHYRPGRRVLTLASPGCSFHCHYCQNYRLSQFGRTPAAPWQAEAVDPEEAAAAAAAQGAALGLSYSEPSLAAELTLALAAAGRPRGVEVLWKSNGFLTVEAAAEIAPALAAVNIDLKSASEARHRGLTGAPLAPILEALRFFVRAGVWVEVSTPVIPGFNSDPASLRLLAEEVLRLGADIPWHLLRFNPEFRMRALAPTHPDTLGLAAAVGREVGLRYVYVERALGAAGRATCCPRCGHQVVSRGIWSTAQVALVSGCCPECGSPIPGVWEGGLAREPVSLRAPSARPHLA
jgi:pyruvate formate lyase activating enzyme